MTTDDKDHLIATITEAWMILVLIAIGTWGGDQALVTALLGVACAMCGARPAQALVAILLQPIVPVVERIRRN